MNTEKKEIFEEDKEYVAILTTRQKLINIDFKTVNSRN